MAHDGKTEAPTAKKKREARKEGNIPRSPELVSWGGLYLGTRLVPVSFANATDRIQDLLHQVHAAMAQPDEKVALELFGSGCSAALGVVAPVLAGMVAWAIIGHLAQTRGNVSLKRLKPKADKLNPLKGIKKLASPQGLWQAGKVLVKAAILLAVAWGPLSSTTSSLAAAGRQPVLVMAGHVGGTALGIARNVALAGLGLGLLDYVISYRRVGKGLKMTKQEVKDEARSVEGDPMVKAQIRARQREMSRNRMLASVADASVVIVNPTHVAVALKYESGSGAPVLVAKGKGVLADKIRERAREHRVPLVRDIPLAWTIHDTCAVDHPIPGELFAAVARILAFVMTVAKGAAVGGVMAVPGSGPALPGQIGRRRVRGAPAALAG